MVLLSRRRQYLGTVTVPLMIAIASNISSSSRVLLFAIGSADALHGTILRTINVRASIHGLRSSSSLGSATGWINPDKLHFDETIHDSETSSATNIDEDTAKIKSPSPSPVERLLIRDRLVYIKHDEYLHLPSSNLSGNKARKFYSLNNIPAGEFPDAVVSYGGPQSNAMLALAAIVSSKNWELGSKGDSNRNSNVIENNEIQGKDPFWELDVLEEDIRIRALETDLIEVEDDITNTPSNQPKQSTPVASSSQPKKRFIYFTKSMPRYLKKYPNGNLLRALALGMEIRTLSHGEYNRLFGGLHGGSSMAPADLDPPIPGKSLWVPQGGACSVATPGSNLLAKEIVDYWKVNGKGMPLAVCLPAGTCTTALLLHRSIQHLMEQQKTGTMDIRVVVIPCVGDDEYARRQMMSLDKAVGGRGKLEDLPWILRPRSDVEYGSARRRSGGYFRFGEPAKAILQAFDEMNEAGLFLDLLYGAPSWSLLLQHWRSRDEDCPIADRQVMYVHSGGLEGIASQLTRYKHKGLLDARTIQSS